MRWLATLLYLILIVMVWGALREAFPRAQGPILFLVTGVLSFVATIFHEAGHAVAVKLIGGRVTRFCVMPFALSFRPLRIRLAHRLKGGGDVGGFVSFQLGRTPSRREDIAIAAAGPAASMLLALVILLILAVASLSPETGALVVQTGAPDGAMPPQSLPSDAAIEEAFRLRRAELAWALGAGLAKALAVLTAGFGIINLVPFDRSDGSVIVRALARRRSA